MRLPTTGKAVTNESKYPHIVGLAVVDDELDVELSRRIMDFHRSRKIQVRHGRTIVREGQSYFQWCFLDLDTARAFMEQFGGVVTERATARPIAANIAKLPELLKRD